MANSRRVELSMQQTNIPDLPADQNENIQIVVVKNENQVQTSFESANVLYANLTAPQKVVYDNFIELVNTLVQP